MQLTYGKTRKVAWYLKAIPYLICFTLGWSFMADVISVMQLILIAAAALTISELVFKDHGWIIEEQKPCN